MKENYTFPFITNDIQRRFNRAAEMTVMGAPTFFGFHK
jgi:hypothetical protein